MVTNQFAVPYSPTAPDFVDAMVDLFTAAHQAAGTDVLIKDGPWITKESARSVIAVGFAGFFSRYERPGISTSEQFGMADVVTEAIQEGLGPSITERHVLTCASLTRVGSTKAMKDARREAYDNITICAAGISPTHGRWPGGAYNIVFGSSSSLSQTQDRDGVLVMVMFSVSGEMTAQQ
jgi:hypothetical protein